MPSDCNLHIIGEAGTNHNGSIASARQLIEIASSAGVHSVKFQIINPYGLYLPGEYTYGHYDIKEVIKMRTDAMLSDSDYRELASYSSSLDIPLSASVFDTEGLDLLTSLSPPYIKIASCDLNNIRFLREVVQRQIKIILSTGMSSLKDIEKSVAEITSHGFNDIILMHCVSVYPAKLRETNLSFITTLKKEFGFTVGFSDHTMDSTAACIAFAMGARWFEKHFTSDKSQDGFDHKHALDANELEKYVSDLNMACEAVQPQTDKLSDAELYTRKRARRSLYAARDIAKGEVLTNGDILVVRPENVMNADDIDLVVGKETLEDIKQHQPFVSSQLKKLS